MSFYYDKNLRRIVFEGEMTGLDSITFSDGSSAVKSSELQDLRNALDSDVMTLRLDVESRSIKILKRNGQTTTINIS